MTGDRAESVRTGLVMTAVSFAALTAVLAPFFGEDEILNVSLLYLLLTLIVSAAWGYVTGLVGAVAADLLVNFFFVPPLHTLTVQEPAHVLALLIFLAVAIVGASMLSLLRRQAQIAEARRAETAALLAVSQEMARAISPRDAMDRLCMSVVRSLRARGCALIWQSGKWEVAGASGGLDSLPRDEEALATEAVRTSEIVRYGGETRIRIPGSARIAGHARVTIVPFGTAAAEVGVLHITGDIMAPRLADPDRLLRAFADEASLALHRARLAANASRVDALQRADAFKSVLLSSVSHDLRSPLTAIKAAVESLRDDEVSWSEDDRRTFLETIERQTDRLIDAVTSLLEMSRLEGGAVAVRMEPMEVLPFLDEIRAATAESAAGRTVTVLAAEDLWLRADYGLLTRAMTNLVENAAKYSGPTGSIRLEAHPDERRVLISVRDDGPGIAATDLPHIFEKFYRGASEAGVRGTGLGLSIVKAMVELCEGTVSVSSNSRETRFQISMPSAKPPPR